MKILRIDLQTNDKLIFDSKEQLRKALIDLHWDNYKESYSYHWGYTNKQIKQKMKKFKQMTLNQLCCDFDWDYQTITDKQATQYE
tara:strand:- start:907 stop:1161 length:255 start_codon:yes stop_codon:yes gene_type:complete